jgi:drug/metabolite transporter (DMT)-like permease
MKAAGRPVYWLTAFVVLANVIGNFALSWGMKHPLGYRLSGIDAVDALVHPYVLLGIVLLVVWTLARVTLLSWADLSFVLPVSSVGYVLNAAIGCFVLGEAISWKRALGTALILAGTVLTAATPPRAVKR